jgi:hypothetical protein
VSTKADIAPGNWAALVSAAPAIARAVSASAGSTGQSETELDAFVQFVSDATISHDGSDVLGQLVGDVGNLLAIGVEPVSGDPYMEGLEQARRAGAIVSVELEPAEAVAIRAWYLAAAQRVAGAASEGGVLGLGSKDVTTWERETIQAIAEALGANAPADPPFEPPAAESEAG